MSITVWNRLECDVIFDDPARGLSRGLAAELYDPLWLLARQHQMAEFRSEDGGSLISSTVSSEAYPVEEVVIDGQAAPFDRIAPLEAIVEREPLEVDLRLRIQSGQMLADLLAENDQESLRDRVAARYRSNASAGWPVADQILLDLAGTNSIDGELVRQAFEAGRLEQDLAVTANEEAPFSSAVTAWLKWYGGRVHGPAGIQADAWVSDRLEHAFALRVPTPSATMVLSAAEYPGGRLDWDSFTIAGVSGAAATAQKLTAETLPLNIEIPGMPVVRYWEMEDPLFDPGRVSVGPGDANRLLLVEFSLNYASDWFMVPVPVPSGALVAITNVVATDTFGISFRIQASESIRPDSSWALWHLTESTAINSGTMLLVPPPPAGGLDGDPIEEVALVRDELANLAWAIELTVPGLIGGGRAPTRSTPSSPPPIGASESVPAPDRIYVPFPTLPADRVPLARLDRPEGSWLARAQVVDERLLIVPTEGRFVGPDFRVREDEVGIDGLVIARRYQLARGRDGTRHVWVSRSKSPGATRAGEQIKFDALAEPRPEPA